MSWWFPCRFADFLSHILDTSDPVSYVALDSNKDDKIVGAIINLIADPEKEGPRSMKTFLDPDKEPIKIQIATFLEDLEDGGWKNEDFFPTVKDTFELFWV